MSSNESLVQQYGRILNDQNERLGNRFRALFSLKALATDEAIDFIGQCFTDSSELLKHELAYCLGQTKNGHALKILENVLKDPNQEPVVRHEAVEAIGAIAPDNYIELLKDLEENDKDIEVRETAHLAAARIKFYHDNKDKKELWENMYGSVDPTPPCDETDLDILAKDLMDLSKSLFDRYRVMFQLRNLVKEDPRAIQILLDGFAEKESALFRHEIAFVFGQIGPAAADAEEKLIKVVEDENEHGMVRHEAAEALGSINTDGALDLLKRFCTSECRIVRESCEVALDQADYYSDETQFQPISVSS